MSYDNGMPYLHGRRLVEVVYRHADQETAADGEEDGKAADASSPPQQQKSLVPTRSLKSSIPRFSQQKNRPRNVPRCEAITVRLDKL